MGMDLQPINPSSKAPIDDYGEVVWGRYNWAGWRWLCNHLEQWGVDLSEFSGCNDGEEISRETCIQVGKAIEDHLNELSEEDREWIKGHIVLWKTCGGYRQF